MSSKKNKKSLLTESQQRRFQGLAGIAPLSGIHPLFESDQAVEDALDEADDCDEGGDELYEGDGVQHNETGPEGAESTLRNGITVKKGSDPYAPGQSTNDVSKGKSKALKEGEEEEDDFGGGEPSVEGDNVPAAPMDTADSGMGGGNEDIFKTVMSAVADALGVDAEIDGGGDELGEDFGGMDDGMGDDFGGGPEDEFGMEDEMLAEGIADLVRRVSKARSRQAKLEERKRQWRERAANASRRTKK